MTNTDPIDQHEPGGKVIAVTYLPGAHAEQYRGTLALNMAAHLARNPTENGRTVCLLDAGTYNTAAKHACRYRPNIVTLATDSADIRADTLTEHLVERDDLTILLGPPTPEQANPMLLTGDLYRDVIAELAAMFDVVVVDLPPADRVSSVILDAAVHGGDNRLVIAAPAGVGTDADQTLAWMCSQSGGRVDPDKVTVAAFGPTDPRSSLANHPAVHFDGFTYPPTPTSSDMVTTAADAQLAELWALLGEPTTPAPAATLAPSRARRNATFAAIAAAAAVAVVTHLISRRRTSRGLRRGA